MSSLLLLVAVCAIAILLLLMNKVQLQCYRALRLVLREDCRVLEALRLGVQGFGFERFGFGAAGPKDLACGVRSPDNEEEFR